MAISVRTRKLLWSTAKGRCAMCGTPLIASRSERDEATSYDIVGEECHIVSRRENGPRSVVVEEVPGAEIDGYDNLVLLCLADHKVIDDNPEEYPVAQLRQIKQSHVQRMQADETLPIVPGEMRRAHLEREMGRSKGRLVAGWIAVGLDEQLAREFAEDDAVGTITDASLLPEVDRPLVIWVAALGSGKTVAAERIHQRGLLASLSDPDEPLPVFLHASEVGGQLEERIEAATATIDAGTGYRLILDGLDEVDVGEADRLLHQARLLKSQRLPVDHTGHEAEMTWLAAQTLMNRGSLNETPISAVDLLERLGRVPPEARFVRDYRGVVDMQPLRNASPRIAAEGALEYPWPTHEPPESRDYGPFVWSGYDADLLGRRTLAIYESALHLYEQLVARWFPRFASRLNRSMLLPAEAVMTLVMPSEPSLGPSVTWHLEALPQGEVTRARIAVGADRFFEGLPDSLWDRTTQMRPRVRPWPRLFRGPGRLRQQPHDPHCLLLAVERPSRVELARSRDVPV